MIEIVSLPSQSLAFAPATCLQTSNTRMWMSTVVESAVKTKSSAINNLTVSRKVVKVDDNKPSGKKKESAAEKSEHDFSEFKQRRIKARVKETGFDSMKHYMKTMGNHELLQKNEEIILAREIQKLIGWEKARETLEAELAR